MHQEGGPKPGIDVSGPTVQRQPSRFHDVNWLEWIKVIGHLVLSWPLVVIVVILVFQAPLSRLFDRFNESEGSTAELGPIKIALGKAPASVAKPNSDSSEEPAERIDLSALIGAIRDSGTEGATVGFSSAYVLQAEIRSRQGKSVTISARGIYTDAKRYDEWPGEDYEGSSASGAVKALKAVGAYLESDWPYARRTKPAGAKPAYNVSAYRRLEGVEPILEALRDGHAVFATITTTPEFTDPAKDGTVTIKLPLQLEGGTSVAIVGYDSKRGTFTFANHWGTGWGRQGFGVIKDTDLAAILQDAYALDL
jgi:hypothetical protein